MAMTKAEMLDKLAYIGKLIDPDCCYDNNKIVIDCLSHGEAIRSMLLARVALDSLRAEMRDSDNE